MGHAAAHVLDMAGKDGSVHAIDVPALQGRIGENLG